MKVTLEPGSIVVLSLDGTLVYIEDVQSTFAAVVALPDQPPGDASKRVFSPGKVGAKKISPFSTWSRQIAVSDLSDRNKDFIANYETWRGKFGPNYIHRTPEEIAAAEAAGTPIAAASTRAARGQGKRALKRAQAKAAAAAGLPVPARKSRGKKAPTALQAKCETCGQQSGHPNHPSDHAFVASTVVEAPEAPVARRTRAAKEPASAGVYTLVSDDLTKAKAQPRGDKFNDGNRSHRVVRAIASLPSKAGTLGEVLRALLRDGGTPLANPQKVARRTLHQLMTEPFGQVVTRQ